MINLSFQNHVPLYKIVYDIRDLYVGPGGLLADIVQ